MSLEAYARERPSFRAKVLEHKKKRTVRVGAHVTLQFEDELTIRYQVQEMLRIERIFEEEGIQGELDAYNPLIPDGSNWKATMLIEYPRAEQRSAMLEKLIGIEDRVWIQIEGWPRGYAVADEDLDRQKSRKTASVHFLRFDLDRHMVLDLRKGAAVSAGVDHPHYTTAAVRLDPAVIESLMKDLVV